MGEIVKADVVAQVQALNPKARKQDVRIYADALVEYREAQANIDEHGAIVFHPRTGSPIENPYTKVRNSAASRLSKFKKMKTDPLWT